MFQGVLTKSRHEPKELTLCISENKKAVSHSFESRPNFILKHKRFIVAQNSRTMDSPMESPFEIPGIASGGDTVSTVEQEQEQETVRVNISWGNIILLLLFVLWVMLLLSMIVISFLGRRKRERSSRASLISGLLAGTIAFILSIVPHMTCQFLDVSENSELLSFGMWSVSYESRNDDFGGDGKCYANYPLDFEVNPAFLVARAAAIISTVIGGISMIALIHYCRMKEHKTESLRGLTAPLFIVTFFQVLTLSAFGTAECTDESCGFLFGSVAALFGAFYWLLCAGSILMLPLDEVDAAVEADHDIVEADHDIVEAKIVEP